MERIDNLKQPEETAPLADTVLEYLHHWKWFVLSVTVCLVVGTGIVSVTPEQYQSSLSILLNEKKGSASTEEVNLETLGMLSATSNIENEIAILSSPDLIRSVEDSLNLRTAYHVIRKFRKTELYDRSPFSAAVVSDDGSGAGNIRFFIQKDGSGYVVRGTYLDRNIDTKFRTLPGEVKLDENTDIRIDLTGKDVVEGEKYYVQINGFSSFSGLSVLPNNKSSVLNISLLSNNTAKGAAILRELVKQYNEMNVKMKNETAYNTAVFINDRLREISVELSDAEDNVVNFKQKNQITDISTEAQLFVQQTGQNEQKLMEAETQLNVILFVERFVNDPKNEYAVIPNIGISDTGLTQIINEYNSKLLNGEALLKGTGEENPTRIKLIQDLDNIRGSISNSLNNVKQTYNVTKQELLRQFSSTKSKVLSVPQQERGLIEKVREQRIKENLFLFLMQKREETNLSIASTGDKARIIASPRENTAPVAPKSRNILLAALIIGLLCPAAVIYTFNLFKIQIKNRNELEKLSEVSVIGQIARNETKDRIVVQPNRNDGTAEMFRSLRNSVGFILKHRQNRVILITSTTAKEGKTFISVNLAASFALSGRKVLLAGGDIRNPKLKDYVQPVNKKGLGLCDYLTGDDSWKRYVNKSGLHDNLHIMFAGTVSPNPNELLMSPRLKDFLEEAKTEYDFVLIDSAPVGLVSDTYFINEYADITLYVVREDVTPKAAVNFINTQKKEGKLTNMYLVLNDSRLDSNYKYGYGKGYGYKRT